MRAWIPQVVLSGQATYQSATPTYPEAFNAMIAASGLEMSGIRKDQYKVAIDVSQNIWDGGQSRANREIAEAEAAESKLEHGVIDATDLLQKIADETTATLNRSTHEIELLQAVYRLKTTLNQ